MTKLEIRELNERWRALEVKGSVKEKRRERGCDERGTAVARRRGEAFAANDLQESLAKCETQNDNDGKQTRRKGSGKFGIVCELEEEGMDKKLKRKEHGLEKKTKERYRLY